MLIDEDHDSEPNAEAALPQQQPPEATPQNDPPSSWDQFPDCSYDLERREITVDLRNTEFGVAAGNAKLKGAAPNEFTSIFHIFKHLSPVNWLKEELLHATNLVDPSLNLTEDEFWIYLGLRFAMARYSDMQTSGSGFFLVNKERYGRFFTMTSLNSVMSGKQFKRITPCLCFARECHTLPFRNPFREFRVPQESFNSHMEKSFKYSWLTTLDESMSPREQPRGCSGHVIVWRKFTPKGNEIHTHACALSKVIFWMEILEGKDATPQIIPKF